MLQQDKLSSVTHWLHTSCFANSCKC